tara:strand:- start:367 stop:1083 length:717 start_codon:yes stop_codon:yes gene_type:complete
MKISLIIPIYNEEKVIKETLEKLSKFIKSEKDSWEVLFINDGSKDNSLKILKNFNPRFFKIVSYENNQGKGFAIKKGVESAKGDYICFIDSDLAYSFSNLKKLIVKLKDYDLVIGSRNLAIDNHKNISIRRRIMGGGFNKISNLILRYNLKDTQCGLKAFRSNVAKVLFSKQTVNDFSFDTEIMYLAKKKKYKLGEENAIVSKNHLVKDSKVNMITDPLKMFLNLLKIRLNDFLGKYD